MLLVRAAQVMPSNAHIPLSAIRQPLYAGSWYESDAERLQKQLAGFLSDAANKSAQRDSQTDPQEDLLAVIAPHAGYIFSGKTAAFAYQAAREQKIKRVFLLGPSHHLPLNGIALPASSAFATPLGNLEVDIEAVEELSHYPLFTVAPEIHRVEHSLEMQLPFIRLALGPVKIIPLVVGILTSLEEIRLAASILQQHIERGDLIVVSSDFTHFGPRYGYQPFKDNAPEKILQLDYEGFDHLARKDLEGFVNFENETQATICGFFPCAILCALLPPSARARLLSHATSRDVMPEDRDNSVSYLAAEFRGQPWPEDLLKTATASDVIQLSEKDRDTLITLARNTLESYVRERRLPHPEEHGIKVGEALKPCFGAFVTLYKKVAAGSHSRALVRQDKELRGCIGSIWPVKPLYKAVTENAIAACSRDYRFSPVQADELSLIEIEISILTPPRRVRSHLDIVLGRDGIILSKHERQSVFLPFVPLEFGWDLPQTLTQLSLKAGLGPDAWQEGARFEVFQAQSVEERR